MNRKQSKVLRYLLFIVCLFALFFVCHERGAAQKVKRVVIIKVDGLPGDYVDNYVKQRDPKTGKSLLPWIEEVFYKNGTRLTNFYSRGMSLSAPSWSLLDTGQHLQIKGNVEYDRLIFHSYDYLNFIPYFVDYSMKKRVDMPGVEVLDQINLPLLCDAFPYEHRYTSNQLFQRGADLGTIGKGFLEDLPKTPSQIIDEWTIGFDFRSATIDQNERHIISRIQNRPEIDYFDYYSPNFDHVSHLNRNSEARFAELQSLDRTIGRIWLAIQNSSRAAETALIVVSDHGMNSDPRFYSQGFNLVRLLGSAEGGGHHVVTKRRLMLDYAIKGLNPFVPLITTSSKESYYLKGEEDKYPTIMLDFDGNERSSLQLRDSDLNLLHILFQQLQNAKFSPVTEKAVKNSFFNIVDRRRINWEKTVSDLTEELGALHRWIEQQQQIIDAQPKKFTPQEISEGIDKDARRIVTQARLAAQDETDYREYLRTLSNLLALKRENFEPKKLKIEDYIAKGAMGERNSIYELQNYVVGLSAQGLIFDSKNEVDFERSFKRINYFDLLKSQKVINNVQAEVGSAPIDFIATRIPLASISDKLKQDMQPSTDPIWLYGGDQNQALILTRNEENGNQSLRYLPISNLRQNAAGKFQFSVEKWRGGFPLKMFEDENLHLPDADKASWLNDWHTELDWLHATHKALYSAAIINLNEQMDEHPLTGLENTDERLSEDEKLIRRFRHHQRRLTETDMLILANNHWNFDVRGFNAGGNHGSFFRISAISTLMFAGGAGTNIPRGLAVEEPYDNLSFVPSVLSLMGKINRQNQPPPELYRLGFRKFPGRIIREVTNPDTAK